jgi:hypothetical protein
VKPGDWSVTVGVVGLVCISHDKKSQHTSPITLAYFKDTLDMSSVLSLGLITAQTDFKIFCPVK